MQTDWGGEYHKLSAFFYRVSIAHLVSCPYTHQQNGTAERKHRHVVEVGLALLSHASMPLKSWDESFQIVAFLINHLLTHVLNYASPIEKLFSTKPAYTFLRTFGCACWPNLRPYNNHKLAFRSKQCVFLGYSTHHKGYNYLDIVIGRVYVSRDVVFDELVFPLAALHSNAGARLRAEISLLSPSLLESTSYGGRFVESDHMPKSTDASLQHCDVQDSSRVTPDEDRVVLLPESSYFLEDTAEQGASDLVVTTDLGGRLGVASPGLSAFTPTLDQLPGSSSESVPRQSEPVHASGSDAAAVATPGGFPPPATEFNVDGVGSSAAATPTLQGSSPATPGDPGSAEVPPGFSVEPVATGSSGPGDNLHASDASTPSVPPHARTRLQNNIVKPKRLFPGMVRYANFCSTDKPESVQEALANPKWKSAMDLEHSTLLHNDTWHLVATQAKNIIDCK
jgi:hypothetical protein